MKKKSGRGGATGSRSSKKTAGRVKQAVRKGRKGGKAGSISRQLIDPKRLFPKLAMMLPGDGKGVFLAVATREKKRAWCRSARLEMLSDPGSDSHSQEGKTSVYSGDPQPLAKLLHGLAHPDRIRLLNAIYGGTRTHQELKIVVQLQPGPIYHHLRNLERAGMIQCVVRNQYQITETGALTLMVLAGFQIITRDSKRSNAWVISKKRIPIPKRSSTRNKKSSGKKRNVRSDN